MDTLANIQNLVSIVTFFPVLGMVILLLLRSEQAIRYTALITTMAAFVLSIGLWTGFDTTVAGVQMVHLSDSWIAGYDVKYFLGVDGLNLLLILLTTFLGPIVVLCSWTYIKKHVKAYYALLLLLQTGIVGVFASFDLLLFYIFFELTLIPMYFIIGIWGGEDRIYAAIKFVLFTLVGSLLMLVGILYLGFAAAAVVNDGVFTTDWFKLLEYGIPLSDQVWLFFVFALAFSIKVPLFPLHTWLPDAHVQAPTGGSVILAGVLLKIGTYGLLRFCLPFFPNAAYEYAMVIAVLAVIGIVYGALVAAAQKDAKKLIAYSSVSHLGFVVLGLFAFNVEAMQGALIQMVNHGLSTGALFLLIGMLYERRHTRLMEDYGGIAKSVPVLSFFMVLTVLASVGLPGLNGFVGEFLILLGTFSSIRLGDPVLVAVATSGVVFAAYYLLWMVYNVFFGTLDNEENKLMPDLNLREIALLVPIAVFMVWIGVAPAKFLEPSEVATTALVDTIELKREAMEEKPLERRIVLMDDLLASSNAEQ
jgi:NADH-quinone oxidoreductase subunit M